MPHLNPLSPLEGGKKGNTMKKSWILGVSLLLVIVLAGCAPAAEPAPIVGGSVSGSLDEQEAMEQFPFEVPVAQPGDPVGIDFRGVLVKGTLQVRLVDAEGTPVCEETFETPGPFRMNTVVTPPEAGTYRLGMAWDGPVQLTSYALVWKPGAVEIPEVPLSALLAGTGMVLVALGFVAYAAMHRLGWSYLGWGALAWVVTVALKFAWAVPVNPVLYDALLGALPESVAMPIFYVYVGALTGIFEVGLTWLVLRHTKLGRAVWERALAFGIGFGAVEAFLLGLASLVGVITAMVIPDQLPLSTLEQIAAAGSVLMGLAPIVERFFTCLVHILSNLLLFYGVTSRQSKWFWAAFVYKTLIDAIAAFAQFWGVDVLWHLWLIEAVVAVWGLIGWWGIRRLRERYPVVEAE